MSYFDGPTDYLVRLGLVLLVGLGSALANLALGLSRPAAQRPALLPVALGLGFATPLLAMPLAFGPLIEAFQSLGLGGFGGAQATLMNSARLLLVGCLGLLANLGVYAVVIAPALGAGVDGAGGRSPRPALVALALTVVALGVFEYSRSGLNLSRYVVTIPWDPAEAQEARERHATLRAEPVPIADLAEAMTRAVHVGAYGGALAFLLVVGLGAAGFAFGRGAESGRGLAQGGLLLTLALVAVALFWVARLGADSAAIEDRHYGSRASVAEPPS